MDVKTRYYKSFLIFNQEDAGYGSGQAPSGYVRIEVRNGKGKLSASVQNLREEQGNLLYKLYIISSDDWDIYPAYVGMLPLSRGKGGLSWEFDPLNVAGTGKRVDTFNTAVVLAEHLERSNSKIICPLAAYKDKRIPWREKLEEKRRAEAYSKSAETLRVKKEAIKNSDGPIISGRREEAKVKKPDPDDFHVKLLTKEHQATDEHKILQDKSVKIKTQKEEKIGYKKAQEEYRHSNEDYQRSNQEMYPERSQECDPAVDENLHAESPEQNHAANPEQHQPEVPAQNCTASLEQRQAEVPVQNHTTNPEQHQAGNMEQYPTENPKPDQVESAKQYQTANAEQNPAGCGQERRGADKDTSLQQERKKERTGAPIDTVTPPPVHEEYGKLLDRSLNDELYGRNSIAFGGCTIAGNAACPFQTPGRNFNQCIGCIGGMTKKHTTGNEPSAKNNFEEFINALNRCFEVSDPFGSKRKDYKWWKVNSPVYLNNILYQYNIRTPLLFNPMVITANFKYRHLILGIYTDKARNRDYIVCGIPGVYGIDNKPFGDMCRWVQLEGSKPKYGAFGYWLVYIDPKTGKFLPLS